MRSSICKDGGGREQLTRAAARWRCEKVPFIVLINVLGFGRGRVNI